MSEVVSSYNPVEEGVLRISKSSFGTYDKCPRLYYWNYIQRLQPPPNDAMVRGSLIHEVLEIALTEETPIPEVAKTMKVQPDLGIVAMDEIMRAIEQQFPDWELVEAEVKHQIPYTVEMTDDEEQTHTYDVLLVGKIDGVFSDKDGKLIIVELKTGELGSSKVSRTRKELNFYKFMLEEAGYDVEDCRYLVIAPDATNVDVAMKLESSKRKTVIWGDTSGIAYLEKPNGRSYNTTMRKFGEAVHGISKEEWPMNWSEYYCPEWCEYHLGCEQEMLS
tara:strand:+ start:567 stop:1394 length:828 start_codon:yes stop_codon:yes gene_type:complete